MIRPKPIAESVVRLYMDETIYIATCSNDVVEWMRANLEEFGVLHPPMETRSYWILNVSELFNADKVRDYISSHIS